MIIANNNRINYELYPFGEREGLFMLNLFYSFSFVHQKWNIKRKLRDMFFFGERNE